MKRMAKSKDVMVLDSESDDGRLIQIMNSCWMTGMNGWLTDPVPLCVHDMYI